MSDYERVHEILYSCDSREELVARIVELEAENAMLCELIRDTLTDPDAWDYDMFKSRAREAFDALAKKILGVKP